MKWLGFLVGLLLFGCAAASKPFVLTQVVTGPTEAQLASQDMMKELRAKGCQRGYVELLVDDKGDARLVAVCLVSGEKK